MPFDVRKFNFLAGLTAIVVILYMAAALFALFTGHADFKDFSAAVGPVAGTLVGYWLRAPGPSS